MHSWGDERVDWQGINDAAEFIGCWLQTYPRMGVSSIKEKFGTVRVYCHFGWHGVYAIWRPGYAWYPKWWPMRLDFWLANTRAWGWLNRVVVAVQQWAYVYRYTQAVRRWPHLYKEIVSAADYGELFEGRVPGYKHSDFWTVVK